MPMIFTEAERNLALSLFSRIASETATPGGVGVTRESYGPGETRALNLVAEAATDLGLIARADHLGNLVISTGGYWPDGSTVIGSHLDSVPSGGNYDGLAGVVAGLLILKKARDLGHAKPLIALGLRGEESAWYGIPYIGAKALFGKLTPDDLKRTLRSVPGRPTLGSRMSMCGDVGPVERGERLLPTYAVKDFWELHIEQGPVLQDAGIPVGIVTGIRGNVRAPAARVLGEAGHSGTTPHHLRKDAVMLFAELMVALEERRSQLHHENGKDIVFTCGVVGTDRERHGITSIADVVNFTLDVRGMDSEIVHGFYDYAKAYAMNSVDWGELVTTPGVHIHDGTWGRVAKACDTLGVRAMNMPSGAGHETAVFAQNGVPAGMVFVRNQYGSHNPHEAMDIDDFMLGIEVLWETIR